MNPEFIYGNLQSLLGLFTCMPSSKKILKHYRLKIAVGRRSVINIISDRSVIYNQVLKDQHNRSVGGRLRGENRPTLFISGRRSEMPAFLVVIATSIGTQYLTLFKS